MTAVDRILRTSGLILVGLLVACSEPREGGDEPPTAVSSSPDDTQIIALIEEVREQHGLPAVGVMVNSPGGVRLLMATGVRKQGETASVTQGDRWHIGSNTKAITATLIGTFVQDGSLSFDTRLAELFPELSDHLSPGAETITVEHVLTHRAGFAPNPFETLEEYVVTVGDVTDVREQRKRVVEQAMSQPLLFAPGSDRAYSNTGFVVAGAIAERLGGGSWEALVEERVLAPLGIESFGFGAPGSPELVDQPWGHRPSNGGLAPVAADDEEHQNPPLLAPAGLVHISLSDWALFASEHISGRIGEGKLLAQDIYRRLHTPPGGKSGFAMGWGALVEDGEVTMLTHNGGDGNWFAEIRIYLETDTTYLMVTNDGREDGQAKRAFGEIRAALNELYEPFPQSEQK